jgi:hypothetical protein
MSQNVPIKPSNAPCVVDARRAAHHHVATAATAPHDFDLVRRRAPGGSLAVLAPHRVERLGREEAVERLPRDLRRLVQLEQVAHRRIEVHGVSVAIDLPDAHAAVIGQRLEALTAAG